jgi:hypothetical protein
MEPMKSLTTKGTKDHEGFWLQIFPPCTLAALVVNDFANCTTTLSHRVLVHATRCGSGWVVVYVETDRYRSLLSVALSSDVEHNHINRSAALVQSSRESS